MFYDTDLVESCHLVSELFVLSFCSRSGSHSSSQSLLKMTRLFLDLLLHSDPDFIIYLLASVGCCSCFLEAGCQALLSCLSLQLQVLQ